jgi:D-alanyl-D-alanine dipeptidase
MFLLGLVGLLAAVTACMTPGQPVSTANPIPPGTTQLILVTTDNWGAVVGSLRTYSRAPGGQWNAAGQVSDVDVGGNGLAWGAGLHSDGQGPQKREGDGKAPAGAFTLGTAFGYDPQPGLRMPYLQVDSNVVCVDDPNSSFYNQIVNTTSISPDWTSAEQMRRSDDLYRLGAVVNHNSGNVPGFGSCIFLHIWRGWGSGTAGCTSMDAGQMAQLLGWLDPSAAPVLVQLPMDQYRYVQSGWELPAL